MASSPTSFSPPSPDDLYGSAKNRRSSALIANLLSGSQNSSTPSLSASSPQTNKTFSRSASATTTESTSSENIDELEKRLEVELKIRSGAENLLRTVKKKAEKDAVMQKLAQSTQTIEKIREKLAVLSRRTITRFGCAHTLSDLLDMIDNMVLSEEAINDRINFIKEKIIVELKLKSGAENLAKVYGTGTGDQKQMSEIFQKIMDANSKINLLKVALQKYETKLGISEDAPPDVQLKAVAANETKEDTFHWKKLSITGKLKLKIISATNLAPAHKKLDAKCIIKVNAQIKAKTGTKSKSNEPEWNEEIELTLDNANEIEIQVVDKNDLYAILFFDIKPFVTDQYKELDLNLEMEPRGEMQLHVQWSPRASALERRDNIGRRGAVKKPKIPLAMIRLLGFKPAVQMATTLQKDNTTRRRTEKQRLKPDVVKENSTTSLDVDGSVKSPTNRSASLDDFVLIRVLGKGNFGKVMLVEEKTTKHQYAIKVLKKDFIVENDEVDSVRTEKKVFQIANKLRHPFLVKMHSCFQTKDRIFFVMEYVSGGDLMMHIQRALFNEQRAKMYAAEVLLALEYLHGYDIVYRDLKLDNILLDLDGHIKVADYGLCKENMGYKRTTNTFCGTPEFMAPEILLEHDYTRAVDWWAFGVLIYEMLLAQSPFKGDEEEEIFDSILSGEVYYPSKLAAEAVSILQGLLDRDPTKRLGGGEGDAADVKAHPFFAEVNWNALLNKQVEVSFKPVVRDARDTTNFDPEFTREVPQLTPFESTLTVADQEEFEGFDFVADWIENNETAI